MFKVLTVIIITLAALMLLVHFAASFTSPLTRALNVDSDAARYETGYKYSSQR